jgi:hypothetical protein
VPEHAEDLSPHVVLIVDDPPGLSPASRAALGTWLERGGVALGLLGPASTATQLSSTVEPFAREGTRWEATASVAVDAQSLNWLGAEAESLTNLGIAGRVRLDAADLPGSETIGSWQDGVPLLFRRSVGRGLVLTLGLPASIDQSDLALRPGFLALLDLVRKEARQRSGPRRSLAGAVWEFPSDARVAIKGPAGTVLTGTTGGDESRFVPERAGRYHVTVDGESSWRFVELEVDELVREPLEPTERVRVVHSPAGSDRVDASPQWALLVLALFALELGTRAFGDRFRRRLASARPA